MFQQLQGTKSQRQCPKTTQFSVENNSSCSKRAPLIFLQTQSRELSAFTLRPLPNHLPAQGNLLASVRRVGI